MKVKAMANRTRQYRFITVLSCAGLLLIGTGWALLQRFSAAEDDSRWVLGAMLALALLVWRIRTAIAREPGKLPEACYPGLANQVTVFRGLLVSLLAGFLLADPPEGSAAWFPTILYSATLILDVLDGFLARLRRETSAFGAFLDRDLDAWGTLIGILLAVFYGRLPVWCIGTGMAYYLFAIGQWRRERRGLPLHPLPPSRYRRHVAAVQSLFIALALWPPALLPEYGWPAALVMIPVLAGFVRDWLTVSRDLPALSRR